MNECTDGAYASVESLSMTVETTTTARPLYSFLLCLLRWRDTKINDIHDFTGYCCFHDKTELGGCFLHSVLLALSLGPD